MTPDTGKKILLVEDEALIAMDEEQMLSRRGFSVVTALTGDEAVRLVAEDPAIDLVLMDIDLGFGMDGTEAARRILSVRELPVVFLTNHCEREMVDRVRDITRYGYVLKSAGEFVLIEAITMAFELFDARMRLAESERRYRWIAENSTDGVALIDGERIAYMSESYRRLLGIEPGELVGRPVAKYFDLMHPEDVPRILETLEEAGRRRASRARYRYRARHAGGDYVWLEDDVAMFYTDSGERSYSFVNARDVTEQHTAETALARREREYRTLFDGAANPIVIYGADGTIVKANITAARNLGSTPEAMAGRSLAEFIPSTFEMTRERLERCLAEQRVGEYTDRLVLPDGSVRWYQTLFQPLDTTDGAPAKVQTIAYDVTVWKEAEAALRTSRELFLTAFKRAPLLMSISTVDDGTYLEVNDMFIEVTGYPRDEVIETRSVDLGFITAGDRARLREAVRAEGRVAGMELALARKDGSRLFCEYYGEIIEVDGANRLLSMAVDITRRKEAEERLVTELGGSAATSQDAETRPPAGQ